MLSIILIIFLLVGFFLGGILGVGLGFIAFLLFCATCVH